MCSVEVAGRLAAFRVVQICDVLGAALPLRKMFSGLMNYAWDDRCMLACVRLPCPADLGAGHLVVCARTMRKRCLTDSKRPGRLRAECHLQSARFCLAKGRPGMDWTLSAKKWDQGKECHQSLGIWDASRGWRDGRVHSGKRLEFSGYEFGLKFCKESAFRAFERFQRKGTTPMAL